MSAYVVKPIDPRAFIDAVRQLGVFRAIVNEPPVGSIRYIDPEIVVNPH